MMRFKAVFCEPNDNIMLLAFQQKLILVPGEMGISAEKLIPKPSFS